MMSSFFRLGLALTGATLVFLSAAVASRGGQSQPQPQVQRVRIGTYDSRAVAVAFGRSENSRQHTDDLHQRHARAKEAGDRKTADQLVRQGQSLQVRRHLQAFSNAPVNDILAEVQDRLRQIAHQRGVVAIAASTDYRDDARVEVVDLTNDLVMLFNPDENTLAIIADLKKQSPLPIEEVAQMDHRKH